MINFTGQHLTTIFDLTHSFPLNIKDSYRHLASSIHVNFILGNETPMVDHTTSVESLDDKGHSIVHGCVNLYHSILDDLHDLRSFINLENLRALIKTGEGHRKNNFGDSLVWDTLKIINSL